MREHEENKNKPKRGYFISIEGTEGSGKTTQLNKTIEYLRQAGLAVTVTREPGGTEIGNKIRELLLDPENKGICPEAECLLYAADRAQHIREFVLPALERGEIVITDRYVDSNIAYQGCGRKLGEETVYKANELAMGGLMPDLTIFLSVAPEKGLTRKEKEENHTLDRLEQEALDFHNRVYNGYINIWEKQLNRRVVRIDADGPIEQVWEQIKIVLDDRVIEQRD